MVAYVNLLGGQLHSPLRWAVQIAVQPTALSVVLPTVLRIALAGTLGVSSSALLSSCATQGETRQKAETTSPPAATVQAAKPKTPTPTAEPRRKAPEPPEEADEPVDDGPRVYAKTRFVWIREFPTSELQWIGFL
jgi:hypothetical protein